MNKIKIAFYIPNLEIGGTERAMTRLLQGLNKEIFQVSLLLTEEKGPFLKEIPQDISIYNFNTPYVRNTFFKLIKYLQKEKPQILVSFLIHVNIISILAKILSKTNTKIIISERTTFSHLPEIAKTVKDKLLASIFLKPLVKLTYPLADAIVCVSKGVAEDLSQFLSRSKRNKIKVIYNPVVNKELYALANQPIDHPWFLNKEIPVILAVGRLTKAKDYPALLKTFSLISQKQKVHLVILGEGEERKNLEELIDKLNISENINLPGFEENPYKYMKKAEVFVLCSKLEGFPNVLVEAMTLGTPVISTNCQSGPNEIIENGKNGILVPVGNEKVLAKAILKILDNPSLAQKFSLEGKKTAQNFTLEKSVKEYEKLFQEVLKH